jgi:hypothetical protein
MRGNFFTEYTQQISYGFFAGMQQIPSPIFFMSGSLETAFIEF